ncbi:TetR/AcrR family transcriptional regulator C-terminal domain-containing protein [Embleya sp. NPDC055664]
MRLHRSDVLAGAMAMLETDGLDKLTMRRLAGVLNVQPSALYWHFAHKQALLDAMSERLMEGVGDVDPDQPGLDRLAELAWRLRTALMSHRDGARVVSGTYVREPNTLRVGQVAIQAVIAAGAPREEAALAAFALLHFVFGHTIEEQARDELVARGAWQEHTVDIDAREYPDVGPALDALTATDSAERFRYGVRLILDGLAARIGSTTGATGV